MQFHPELATAGNIYNTAFTSRQEKNNLRINSKVCCERVHPPSTFDPAIQYSSHGKGAHYYAELATSSPVVAEASTQLHLSTRDGQDEWD